MNKSFILIPCVVGALLAQTQTPIAAISAYYLNTGQSLTDPLISSTPQYKWAHLNPPLTGYLDSTNTLQLGVNATNGITVETGCSTSSGCTILGNATILDIEPGIGILCVPQLSTSSGVMTLQCSSDTAIIAYRVDPPTASGPCVNPATNNPYGASTWAADANYFYTCVSVPSAPTVFAWARIPLTTGW